MRLQTPNSEIVASQQGRQSEPQPPPAYSARGSAPDFLSQNTASFDMPLPVQSTASPGMTVRLMMAPAPTAVPGPKPPPGGMVRTSMAPELLVQVTMKVPAASPATLGPPLSLRADSSVAGPQVPPAGRSEANVGLPVA